ncbi:MAG: response regulator [Nevskiaceae bacterium]|nr:MAG: response regulator [Nevskiaceae bacterium]TBR74318.1 MAG: response regulator [Nevskiaceae bacterium]
MTDPRPASVAAALANGLHLLRAEIGSSLARVRAELERYHDHGNGDPRPLLDAADALRQVSGSVTMVQCFGAAAVADEMQRVVAATLTGKLQKPAAAFAAVSAAALQLSDYVDALAAGVPDCAIVLQPAINELRVARGAAVLDEAGLFALQATPLVEAADVAFQLEGPAATGDSAERIAKDGLDAYQHHFIQWFRSGAGAAAGAMKAVAAHVAAAAVERPVGRAWQGMALLLESIEAGPGTVTPALKHLVGRSSMELRQLAQRGEAAAAPGAGALAVDVLFGLLQLPARSAAAQRLLDATQLARLLPDPETLDRARARLRVPGAGVLQQVEAELRRDFQAVEDAIDLAVRTQGRAGEAPPITVERLTRIGDTLGMLGLPRLQQMVRNQAAQIPTLDVGDPRWLEVATALVRVQDTLGRALGRADAAQGGMLEAGAEADDGHADAGLVAFAGAARVECGRVEQALTEYARSADAQHLQAVPAQLHDIVQGLKVAGLDDAAQALEVVWGYVNSPRVEEVAHDAAAAARLADACAAAEIYLEALRDRVPHPGLALGQFVRRVEPLQAHAEAAPDAAVPTAPVEPIPGAAPTPTPVLAPTSAADGDPEIRAIFLEEAQEVMAAIRHALPPLKHDLNDRAALTEIRRGFHTLKGSGRMVGASGVGEFSWALEQLLNRCLEGTLAVRAPILALVEQATALLPRLLAALEAGDAAAAGVPETAQLAVRADALRQGEATAADPDLYAVFRDDARARLGFVEKWLAQQDGVEEVAVEPGVVRAFHTLRGSAAVAGAEPVHHVAGALEVWLERVGQAQQALQADGLALLADARAALERWIGASELTPAAETESAALEARVVTARGALAVPAAGAGHDRDAYTLAALAVLQDAEAEARAWCEAGRPEGGARTSERCVAFAAGAIQHGCPSLAEIAQALAERLKAVSTKPSPALLPALEDVFEALYQRLDAIRDGAAEADPAPVLDLIAGLPMIGIHGPRPTPAVSAVEPELRTIFLEEARELLHECREALADMAGPEAAAAMARLQRALHTLKGSARMAGELDMGSIAQGAQERLGAAGAQPPFDPEWLADLGAACTRLEQLWQHAGGQDELAASAATTAATVHAGPEAVEAPPAAPDTVDSQDELQPTEVSALEEPVATAVREVPAMAESAGAPAAPDAELLEVFVPEAMELLETLDLALAHWDDPEHQADARRALHTLKGSARVAGLDAMGDTAHALETALAAHSGDVAAGRDTLQVGIEKLHAMCDALQRGEWQALQRAETTGPAEAPVWTGELLWTPVDDALDPQAALGEFARIPVEVLDRMLGAAGEAGTQRLRLVTHNEGLRTQLAEMARAVDRTRTQLRQLVAESDAQIAARGLKLEPDAADGAGDRYAEEFDPLEMDRYSHMQELSRTLAEAVDDLGDLHATMDRGVGEADVLLGQQSQTLAGVQQELMDTLLVPFSREQGRLERVVRQTAHAVGKSAVLRVEGGETELDRNVLQRMVGPLGHLLRNAVVHGIEAPARRRSAGKPLEGQVRLGMRREAGQIVLEVSDDGRGLDLDAIRRKGIERGLIAADAVPGDEQLGRLIFEPGFSTAETVTQQAGRGIGLDVVADVIHQLGGRVELRARPGVPLVFVLHLPLSMAISHALLVRVGGERYLLPLVEVAGVARIPVAELPARLQKGGAPVAWGGDDYAVHYLGDFLDLPRPARFDGRSAVAVLVRAGETLAGETRRVALVVDALLGTQEVLAKGTGAQLMAIAGIAGAAALPDGGVALTLDMAALVARRSRAAAGGRTLQKRPMVMVVDDSVTMRRVAERLLVRNGFRVVTARDGLEAMDLLRDETPAVVLLDIEMPRADGFEVAAFIRHDPRIQHTPIIMITSRSGEKHRDRARQLGVERYLIKPWQEQQLLDEISAVRGAPDAREKP